MMTQPNTAQEYSVHPATQMGHVALTVASLENQILFYEKAIGLKLHWREGNKAGLGAGGADLLQLTEEPNLKRYRGGTGLYHFAILFPNRRELAIAMARLFALKIPNSPTDHVMTKTTYLSDPEGNGIELYCESPEDGSWTIKDGNYEARWQMVAGAMDAKLSMWMRFSPISKKMTDLMGKSLLKPVWDMSICMCAIFRKPSSFIMACSVSM